MSSSQSGPYQSKVFSYVVRQTRQWIDQGKIAFRRFQVTANWTAQTLLYPVYVAFQSVRLIGTQLKQALELGLPALRSIAKDPIEKQETPTPIPAVTTLTADTPIQRALLAVQTFSLPINLPVQIEPKALALTCVRGVATRLDSKSLVLVTSQNQLLDILTPQQQDQLCQRIEWEIARYERYQFIRQTTQQALSHLRPFMQAMVTKSQQLPPVQALQQAVKTQLQTQPCQQMGMRLQQIGAWSVPKLQLFGRNTLLLGERLRDRLLPTTPVLLPSADIQIRQILWKAQKLSLTPPSLPPAFPRPTLFAPAAATASLSPSPTSISTPLSPAASALTTESIQGIATLLETRSLVLVTNQNQILDILSVEQQTQLQQRIIWEVANYGRYQHLRQKTRQVFSRLQSASQESHVLPPVRAFRQLMAWVQASPIAVTTNLFQEADLVPAIPGLQPLPVIAGSPHIRALFAKVSSLPLIKPAATSDVPAPPRSRFPLPLLNAFRGVLTVPLNLSPSISSVPAAITTNIPGTIEKCQEWSPIPGQQSFWETSGQDFLETSATSIEYVLSPTEQIFRWLDRLLLWIEKQIARLWQLIQKLGH